MFSNFAWSEILVIVCVAIIVVGPKDLPQMLRSFGKALGTMKRMAGDFQRQFNDAIKETELDELKNMTSSKGFGPLEDARKSMEDLTNSINEPVESVSEIEAPAVEQSSDTAPDKPASEKPSEPKPTTPQSKAGKQPSAAANKSKASAQTKADKKQKTAAKSAS